jgi:hypothetical protein
MRFRDYGTAATKSPNIGTRKNWRADCRVDQFAADSIARRLMNTHSVRNINPRYY